jgi:hypothetical protein
MYNGQTIPVYKTKDIIGKAIEVKLIQGISAAGHGAGPMWFMTAIRAVLPGMPMGGQRKDKIESGWII